MKNRKLKNRELNRKSKKEYLKSKKTPLILILDDIRSGHNVGSILRTADAFLISKVYICGISPVPPHKEVMKTALGSNESVDWEYKEDIFDLITKLKNNDCDPALWLLNYLFLLIEFLSALSNVRYFFKKIFFLIFIMFNNFIFFFNYNITK